MKTSAWVRAGLSALGVYFSVSLAACENDPRPRAEPAPREPATAPAANTVGMCGAEEPGPEGTSCGCNEPATGPIVPITEAKVGDRTRCPVSHTVFTVKASSPSLEYEGKTYHFCCAKCIDRFRDDPASFLAG